MTKYRILFDEHHEKYKIQRLHEYTRKRYFFFGPKRLTGVSEWKDEEHTVDCMGYWITQVKYFQTKGAAENYLKQHREPKWKIVMELEQ